MTDGLGLHPPDIVRAAATAKRADPKLIGRMLRIRLTEPGRADVNLAVPLTLARHGLTFGAVTAKDDLARHGIDLDRVVEAVESVGQVVDVTDVHGRVEIFVQ